MRSIIPQQEWEKTYQLLLPRFTDLPKLIKIYPLWRRLGHQTHKNSLSSPCMDEILYLQCFGIENQHLSWPKSFSKLKCQFREILQGHLLCSLVWSVGERIVRMALELLLLGLDHVF